MFGFARFCYRHRSSYELAKQESRELREEGILQKIAGLTDNVLHIRKTLEKKQLEMDEIDRILKEDEELGKQASRELREEGILFRKIAEHTDNSKI